MWAHDAIGLYQPINAQHQVNPNVNVDFGQHHVNTLLLIITNYFQRKADSRAAVRVCLMKYENYFLLNFACNIEWPLNITLKIMYSLKYFEHLEGQIHVLNILVS